MWRPPRSVWGLVTGLALTRLGLVADWCSAARKKTTRQQRVLYLSLETASKTSKILILLHLILAFGAAAEVLSPVVCNAIGSRYGAVVESNMSPSKPTDASASSGGRVGRVHKAADCRKGVMGSSYLLSIYLSTGGEIARAIPILSRVCD